MTERRRPFYEGDGEDRVFSTGELETIRAHREDADRRLADIDLRAASGRCPVEVPRSAPYEPAPVIVRVRAVDAGGSTSERSLVVVPGESDLVIDAPRA